MVNCRNACRADRFRTFAGLPHHHTSGAQALYLGMKDPRRALSYEIPCPAGRLRRSRGTQIDAGMLQLTSVSDRPSLAMPLIATALALAIFVVDTVTSLDIAIAVLYVAVVLLTMDFAGQEGILVVAAGCVVLTLLSFAIAHGAEANSGPILRVLVSLSAIAITALLAVRNQRTLALLREQASLLDLTHDTIFVRNHDDVITYWNRAASELYGWTSQQAVGRNAAELLQTQFPMPPAAIMSELLETGRWEGELIHRNREGRRIIVASRWALQRDGRGRPASVLETNNDVTERRSVEDGLHRAQSELAHVARVATLGELTASIAHEVNQPLAAVVTNGEAGLRWLAREVPDIGEARKSMEHMIRNAQRASEVVRRLRALSRRGTQERAPVAPAEIVNEVAMLIGRELLACEVALSIEIAKDLPQVSGDRVQLQQIFMNLLMNGIQAMVRADIRQRRLGVEVSRGMDEIAGGDCVIISVSDSGPGVDPEHLPHLFEAFFTTREDGMGMGLSICRSIVEAHGGRIWAENLAGGGACFRVSLPVSTKEGAHAA